MTPRQRSRITDKQRLDFLSKIYDEAIDLEEGYGIEVEETGIVYSTGETARTLRQAIDRAMKESR